MPDTVSLGTGHAATVRRYFGLIDDGDLAGSVALFAPDAVYRRPGHPPFEGRERIAHFYLELRTIRSGSHSFDAVLVDGHRTAVHGGFRGTGFDGRPIDLRFSDFFEFDTDGAITRRDTYFFAPLA
ncbi:nuclear transport factor 2 family protein [Amycolatopsis magusensis]|uniref:nuclear transport factor 2 family protein n=1 Tax=Amycolatopsis magusensis TaxID=882444 RepID=UPI0024A7A546|nr:nuclear transport factor 2 family protein [Amycolatopsis magusensis]MDI5982659.1 nuclear transport factor 2 family protein [Amycolatopsis magusensis]